MNKKTVFILVVVVIIVGALAWRWRESIFPVGKNSASNIVFEKQSSTEPCPGAGECFQNVRLYNSGRLVVEGPKGTGEGVVSASTVDGVKQIIRDENLLDRECPFEVIVGLSTTYKLNLEGKTRELKYPACNDQLVKIDSLLRFPIETYAQDNL